MRAWYGHFDWDRRTSPVTKLADARAQFLAKFGTEPNVVVCNIVDANALRDAGVTDVVVRDNLFIGRRGMFYVGVEP